MRTPIGHPFRALLPALFVLALVGCAASQNAVNETAEKPAVEAVTAAASDAIRADARPIAGLKLNPLTRRSGKVQYTEGERKGKTFATQLTETEGNTWTHHTVGVHSMVMKDDGGALVMLREEDVAENVAITYDPPFVLLPKEVAMGRKFEGRTTMTVSNLKTGSRRDSGPCTYTVELLGMQKVSTPAGEFDAYLFKTMREIDLSLAKVNITIVTAHVPDVGIVITRVERNTKAIGIFSMNKLDESRLAK